jgi:hypothetical protein
VATLDEIDAAVIAALEQQSVWLTTPGVRCVDRFVLDTQSRRPLLDQLLAATGNRLPAALLWLEGEEAEQSVDPLLGEDPETVGRSTWSVVLCVADPRPVKDAVKGGAVPGLYALASAVRGALNGLPIDALWRQRRLRYRGIRWLGTKPGQFYALAVRYEAPVAVPQAPDDEATAVPLSILANVQKRGGLEDAEAAADVQFQPDLTED